MPLKVVPKPACDPEMFRKPAMNVHRKKSTNESKGKLEQKFHAAYGTIFRISKCFHRSNQKLHINFSLELGRLKNYKPFAHVQNITKYSTGDTIPLRSYGLVKALRTAFKSPIKQKSTSIFYINCHILSQKTFVLLS